MLNYIKDKIELFKANQNIRKTEKYYLRKLDVAEKAKKSEEECEQIFQEMVYVKHEYEDQVKSVLSSMLIRKAEKLNVPIPVYDDDEMWEGKRKDFLSDVGRRLVSKAVRQEIKERIDVLIPIITAITGLVGAVIGLFSILKK